MKVTVDDIMKLHPCYRYPRERVEELWGGKPYLTSREISELDIPLKDKVWTLRGLMSFSQRAEHTDRSCGKSYAEWIGIAVEVLENE